MTDQIQFKLIGFKTTQPKNVTEMRHVNSFSHLILPLYINTDYIDILFGLCKHFFLGFGCMVFVSIDFHIFFFFLISDKMNINIRLIINFYCLLLFDILVDIHVVVKLFSDK